MSQFAGLSLYIYFTLPPSLPSLPPLPPLPSPPSLSPLPSPSPPPSPSPTHRLMMLPVQWYAQRQRSGSHNSTEQYQDPVDDQSPDNKPRPLSLTMAGVLVNSLQNHQKSPTAIFTGLASPKTDEILTQEFTNTKRVDEPQDTTIESDDTTTKSQATTTESQATTTESQDTTTESQDTTTESHDTTTESHDTTVESQDTTTKSQATTTESQDTTTESQDATTESQDTTTECQDTTTESRDTTVESHDTTTESRVTTVESQDTTVESQSTAARDNLECLNASVDSELIEDTTEHNNRIENQEASSDNSEGMSNRYRIIAWVCVAYCIRVHLVLSFCTVSWSYFK